MAAKTNTTTSAQITVKAREIDFVTRFAKQWTILMQLLSIMRAIRKTPGTKLASLMAKVDGDVQGGATVAEGDVIPLTKMKVEPVDYQDITIEKYAKAVTIETVAKYGAEIGVQKTDEAFLHALQTIVMNNFINYLKTGKLVGKQKTWQRCLAIAKGAVLERFQAMNLEVTEVVGFANTMDLYDWLGDREITIQSQFGLQYIKDFMGYRTLFLLPGTVIPAGTVIATPVENLDLYYIDPGDSEFTAMGLDYTVTGDTNLIGVHMDGNYERAQGETYALMGMVLWAEYLDGIAVVTKGNDEKMPAVAEPAEEGT